MYTTLALNITYTMCLFQRKKKIWKVKLKAKKNGNQRQQQLQQQ